MSRAASYIQLKFEYFLYKLCQQSRLLWMDRMHGFQRQIIKDGYGMLLNVSFLREAELYFHYN